MFTHLEGEWEDGMKEANGISYICGYCSSKVGPSEKYVCSSHLTYPDSAGEVLICPNCNKPTYLNNRFDEQVPGPLIGNNVSHLTSEVEQLYEEARKCISIAAFTSSVLACRKLLMNVSVSKGAEAGKTFSEYVNFLESNHYMPPNSKGWIDHIRKKGNEATHEIPSINQEDAVELLEFTEMLLRFVYELPGKMQKYTK